MEGLESRVFSVFGPPKVIIEDQGGNLNSSYCQKVYDSCGVKSIRIIPYRPQSNVQNERFDETLGVTLTTAVLEDKDKWVDFLETVTYGNNTTINETTNISPFELVFGYNINIPFSSKMGHVPNQELDRESIEEKRNIARNNIIKNQK